MTQIRTETNPAARWWTPRWWGQDARWLALLGPALIFAGHGLYGATLPKTALTLGFASALLLLAGLLSTQVRRDVGAIMGLRLPIILFGMVLGVALWSMTPFAPGGPHPVWSYTDTHPGAVTLDKSQTLLELSKLLGLGVIFSVALMTGASDRRARLALNILLLFGALTALWAFIAMMGGAQGVPRHRLQGPFLSPNTAATLFVVLFLLTLGPLFRAARSPDRQRRFESAAPYAGAALVFLACILASASRGGTVAAAAGLITFGLLLVFGGRVKLTRALVGLLALLIALAAATLLAGDLLLRRLMEGGFDPQGRRMLFEAHWEAFKGAPWMGYGLGSFDTVHRLILNAGNVREIWTARAAHNVYLGWLEQAGVIGALPMFGCIAVLLVASLGNMMRRQRMTMVLYGLLAASVAVLVHGLTDFALETYSMAAFWAFLLGLQYSASQGSSTR